MTVEELIEQAEIRSEEVYSDEVWIGFINAALDDLTPVAKLLRRVTLTALVPVNDMIIIDVTDEGNEDLLNSHEVLLIYYQSTTPASRQKQLRRISLSDSYSTGWKRTEDTIILQGITGSTAGTVVIDTYRKLDHVAETSDIPDLPEQYHQLVLMYICSLSQQKEEELEDKRDFFGEYLMGKNQMAIDRTWEMEPHHRKTIKDARIAGGAVNQEARR